MENVCVCKGIQNVAQNVYLQRIFPMIVVTVEDVIFNVLLIWFVRNPNVFVFRDTNNVVQNVFLILILIIRIVVDVGKNVQKIRFALKENAFVNQDIRSVGQNVSLHQ